MAGAIGGAAGGVILEAEVQYVPQTRYKLEQTMIEPLFLLSSVFMDTLNNTTTPKAARTSHLL